MLVPPRRIQTWKCTCHFAVKAGTRTLTAVTCLCRYAKQAYNNADRDTSTSISFQEFKAWAKSHVGDKTNATDLLSKFGLIVGPDMTETLALIASIKKSHPDNLAMKYFDEAYYNSLAPELQERLIRCVRTGFENKSSGMGCYAMAPGDYDTFNPFFDPVIRDYHGASADAVHVTDWDASAVGDNGVLDVSKLGLDTLSMRVRVGRNLDSFNLPGAMDRAERIKFEQTIVKAFAALQANPEYGGKVYSLSPDLGEGEANPNLISEEKYQELVDAHVMFKDMDADPYLKSAGISSDWPYGRGCWQSDDGQCIIWFGEEDQLRIMCMKKGTKLNEVFERLNKMLQVVESIDGISFARSDKYGYVTSCPTNLGTGMRASVHIKLPNLTSDGTDRKAKEVCKPLGLSVRGTGGEHTPIGADGTVDISPRARLFIKERDIIAALYNGIELLMAKEKEAAAGAE